MTNTTSRASTFPTSFPSSPLIKPSSTSSSSRPIGTSINPEGCPSINNTILTTTNGQQYQIQCYREYGGPVSIGLDQPYFRDCIEQCSHVNAGFSAVRCYGTTWLKYASGIHCNLKTQSALSSYTTNYEAVSAVRLTGVVPPIVGQFRGGAGADGAEENTGGAGNRAQLPDDRPGTRRMAKVSRWIGF
ncbi:MAG: hypothetical protein Q9166_001439 [cf. Caloplaca sp. 2 TL-2023]